jgi:hypothetical protein
MNLDFTKIKTSFPLRIKSLELLTFLNSPTMAGWSEMVIPSSDFHPNVSWIWGYRPRVLSSYECRDYSSGTVISAEKMDSGSNRSDNDW